MGMVFAAGLTEQVDSVVRVVERMMSAGSRVSVVALGLSRGGMACLMLAQALSRLKRDHGDRAGIELRMILFDPVPGNSITSARMDFLGVATFANQYFDMSGARNVISEALALYPYEPLPDTALHAPLLPLWAPETNVVEEPILGCHQGACFAPTRSLAQRLSFLRLMQTLQRWGMPLPSEKCPLKASCVEQCGEALVCAELLQECRSSTPAIPSVRATHSRGGRMIRCHANGQFLNAWHREACIRLGLATKEEPDGPYLLQID